MYFGQFFDISAIGDHLVEACGDRSVYILDGRNHIKVMEEDCIEWGKKHGFVGYQICKGESFIRSQPITKVKLV